MIRAILAGVRRPGSRGPRRWPCPRALTSKGARVTARSQPTWGPSRSPLMAKRPRHGHRGKSRGSATSPRLMGVAPGRGSRGGPHHDRADRRPDRFAPHQGGRPGEEPLADRAALPGGAGALSAPAGLRRPGVESTHEVVRQACGDGPPLGRRVSASASQCLRGVLPPHEGPAGAPQSDPRHGPYMSPADRHDAAAGHPLRATRHGRLRTTVP
jgi:hypothetical protein